MARLKTALVIAAVVLLAGGLVYWRLATSPPAGPAVPPGKAENADDLVRRRLLGTWEDQYQGKRTMSLNADGTGTMQVELSGLQAALFAARLRFDLRWTLDGKVLTKKTIGGEPADKVNLILNSLGNTAVDTILEMTDDRLLLLDRDGKTHYDWRRPSPAGKPDQSR